MINEVLYKEKLTCIWTQILLVIVTLSIFISLIFQILIAPIGERPAPNWVLFLLLIVFLGITLNFRILSIVITTSSIIVAYGLVKSEIVWNRVESCSLDKTSAWRYGGWGIRLRKIAGRWGIVYSIIGGQRVTVSLNDGAFKDIVFSTKYPEEVMDVIRKQIKP